MLLSRHQHDSGDFSFSLFFVQKIEDAKGQFTIMSSPHEKKRKTGGNPGGVQRKRGAEQDLDVPTLGQVAEEARFAPLCQLLEPVKDTPVSKLGRVLRAKLEEKGGEALELVLASFFDECDARAEEAAHKRAHVASEEPSPGKQQRWLFFPSLSLSLSLSLSPLLRFFSLCVADLPFELDARAGMLMEALKVLPSVSSPSFPEPSDLGARWPLLDRNGPVEQIKEAVQNNVAKQAACSVQKQAYKCVVITGAAGSGKTRLCHEGMRAVATAERSRPESPFSAIYEVFITFLNGEQITADDAIGDTLLEQAGVALGMRVACRLFPLMGLCSQMPLDTFRAALQRQRVDMRLLDLRTVLRVCGKQRVDDKQTMVLLTLDESYYAEEPMDTAAPRMWRQMMTKLLEYVIPGEQFKPQVEDGVLLFPILSSTWSAERTRAFISPVDKVPLDLAPLSRESLFGTICTHEHLGIYYSRPTQLLVNDARFQSFLLSCALAPRAVAAAIECVSRLPAPEQGMTDDFRALAIKQVCLKMHGFYKRARVGQEVFELALSGVTLPEDLDGTHVGGQRVDKWLAMGFATGSPGQPLAVPFPLLYSQAGVLLQGIDQFLNWGQPFYWQHFEALVPHIIRLRCSVLYRLKENHRATLAEIFGSGPADPVNLHPAMTVVTCSKQWLVPKRGRVKTVAQQLKVKMAETNVAVGGRELAFGSRGHVFAAADGNVHFDGHLSVLTEDGRSVLVCYQVKHTHITKDKVRHFTWAQVCDWLRKARDFMNGYSADIKLFVMVTNKKVLGLPGQLDEDFVLIHQGNLGSFFAPCLLASAKLATDDPSL